MVFHLGREHVKLAIEEGVLSIVVYHCLNLLSHLLLAIFLKHKAVEVQFANRLELVQPFIGESSL